MRKVQEERGIKIKTLEDEPVLGRHLNWVWQAFSDLNYRRPVGMSGPCPITFTDIEAYCRLKGIYHVGERERLVRYVDLLDREWMRASYEESKRTSGSGSSPPPPQQPPRNVAPSGARRPPRKAIA